MTANNTDQTVRENCPACGSAVFETFPDLPDPVCDECGFVLSDDHEPPNLEPEQENSYEEPSEWSNYYSVTNETEKQVALAFEEIEQLGDRLELSEEVRRRAAEIYGDGAVNNITDGRSLSVLVAAVVCIATRKVGRPYPSDRIANAMDIDSRKLKRVIRSIQKSLGYEYSISEPCAYTSSLCHELDLSIEAEEQAKNILESLDDSFSKNGKHPAGIAGAALYVAACEEVTQRQIARNAGITQETIRVRLSELRDAGVRE